MKIQTGRGVDRDLSPTARAMHRLSPSLVDVKALADLPGTEMGYVFTMVEGAGEFNPTHRVEEPIERENAGRHRHTGGVSVAHMKPRGDFQATFVIEFVECFKPAFESRTRRFDGPGHRAAYVWTGFARLYHAKLSSQTGGPGERKVLLKAGLRN